MVLATEDSNNGSLGSPFDEVSCQEYATLRVPYEMLNKAFRNGQKDLERVSLRYSRECTEKVLKDISNENIDIPAEKFVRPVMLAKERCFEAAESLEKALDAEIALIELMEKRCEFLDRGLRAKREENMSERSEWEEERATKYVCELLLRFNLVESARCLAKRKNMEYLIDMDLYAEALQVVDSIKKGNANVAMEWCLEHRSRLRKTNSPFESFIRMLLAVEHIKKEETNQGISMSRLAFAALPNDDSFKAVCENNMLLLMMGTNDSNEIISQVKQNIVAHCQHENRWQWLSDKFMKEFKSTYQLSTQSTCSLALQMGLIAHYTPYCIVKKDVEGEDSAETSHTLVKNTCHQCLACDATRFKVLQGLPFAHLATSRVLCSLNGNVLDENNPPFALTSGYIYGENCLKDLENSNGDYVCRVTNIVCPKERIVRLYIL